MLCNPEPRFNLEPDSFALVSRSDNNGHKKPWCEHCKKPWHTKETCWKIHSKPQNFKKKNESDGRAFQTMSEDSQGPQINSEMPNFTKEQLGHLYKLFQSSQFSNPSCSLAQQGNYLIAALSSIKSNVHCPWIIDSGATDHMTWVFINILFLYTVYRKQKDQNCRRFSFSYSWKRISVHFSFSYTS